LWGKDFCLPDEETIQRKTGEKKMKVDGWMVEVDGGGAKIWQLGSFLLFFSSIQNF